MMTTTYREFYGDENPWVQWLERKAPKLLYLSPTELRRYMRDNSWAGPRNWEKRVEAKA